MGIEELKLIVNTMAGVSDGALTAAIIWMAKGYFQIIVCAGVGVFAIIKASWLLTRLMDNIGMTNVIYNLLGVNQYSFGKEERKKVIDILSKALSCK